VTKIGLALMFGLLILCSTFVTGVPGAHAQAVCSANSRTYTVNAGDTLSSIASRYGTSASTLASYNALADANQIDAGQMLCIPAQSQVNSTVSRPVSSVSTSALMTQVQPSGAAITAMIYQVFGPYGPAAVSVAMCESSLNPNAYNPISIGGGHAEGLFQILYPSTWYGTSQAAKSPYDANANIIAAHEIFVRDGYSWREWQCQP
jgi:LysM repeat protein